MAASGVLNLNTKRTYDEATGDNRHTPTPAAATATNASGATHDGEHKSPPGSGSSSIDSARSQRSANGGHDSSTVFHVRKRTKTGLEAESDAAAHSRIASTTRQLYFSYGITPPASTSSSQSGGSDGGSQPQPSILSAMAAQSSGSREPSDGAVVPASDSPPRTFPYTLPPVSAIRSPRRALVCASLEATASLTPTAIHPAILHSLSVRLQAMDDSEAEIVLGRLQQLAQHIEQQHWNTAQSAKQAAARQQAAAAAAAAAAASSPLFGPFPHSAMPGLSSISSVDSGGTSNTTSPTISPAVRASSPPAPPSPGMMHLHTASKLAPATGSHPLSASASQIPVSAQRDAASHPPLHPHSATAAAPNGGGNAASPYAQMLLQEQPATASSTARAQQMQMHVPRGPSAVVSSTSPAATAAAAPTAAALDPVVSSSPTPPPPSLQLTTQPTLVRGVSNDSGHIPSGLMMLIEALPGTQPQTQPPQAGTLGQLDAVHATMRPLTSDASQGIAAPPSANQAGPDGSAAGELQLTVPTTLARSTSC